MKAQYQISKEDYIGVMKLAARRSPVREGILILIAVALSLLSIQTLTKDLSSLSAWILLVLSISIFIYPYVIVSMISSWTYRKYRDDIELPRELERNEDGLLFFTKDAQMLVRWDKITKWRQDDKFILIYTTPFAIHIVPKLLKEQGFDIDALVEILERRRKPV